MPFDQEDVLSEPAIRPFEPGRREAIQHDEAAPRCACPACAGLVDSDKVQSSSNPTAFLNAADRGDVAPNGKPSKTVAEAAYQLNRTYASWNDFWTQPGVADVDNKWDDPYWGGAPSIVTFAFRSTAPGSMPDDTGGFTRFTDVQIAATLLALAAWADVANIVFVRVGEGTSGDAAYSNSATMLFANYATGAAGAAAFAYYPSLSANGGDVWINDNYSNPVAGNYDTLALIHEIGHAIGFSHPGSYNAEEGVSITYAANAEYYEDSHQYTVMSYFTEGNTGGNFGPDYPATIMLDDIAAAQRTYGVNTTTRTGDTVYGFNATADRPWFVATSSSSRLVFAIWDAGGVDTLDFSGYSQAQTITLIQGHFSSVGGLTGNVAIAIGAVIENAIGGSGADTIIGNAAANRLVGNAGADTLTGNGGADSFVATIGGGADTITDFSAASDLIDVSAFGGYVGAVQSGLDTIVTIAAGVTFTLLNFTATALTAANFLIGSAPPPAGYNLINGSGSGETLQGTAASDQMYGGAGNDTLNGLDMNDWLEGGDDNDILNGGTGADTMIGGWGNDTFVVDNVGDVVTETAGTTGGIDTVQTSLASYTLNANLENLTGTATTAQALTGHSGDNIIGGGSGNDTLTGGGGFDIFLVKAGGGQDTITDFTNDRLDSSALGALQTIIQSGADTLITYAGGVTVRLTGVDATTLRNGNFAQGTLGATPAGYNQITGGAAGDTLTGLGVSNNIQGLAGNDTITGGRAADWLDGGANNDTITGGSDSDRLFGGDGDDVLIDFATYDDGTSSEDILEGGAGNDTFHIAGGDTVIEAVGGGTDTVHIYSHYYTLAANVENLVIVSATHQAEGNGLANVITIAPTALGATSSVLGLGGNDVITGNAGANSLDGGDGDDVLSGGDGNDILVGNDGADILNGGLGDDTFTGGAGVDTLVMSLNGGADKIWDFQVGTDLIDVTAFGAYQSIVQSGADTLVTVASGVTLRLLDVTASTVTAASFVGLVGAANIINGTTANNVINGTAGIDHIFGLSGNDTLRGGGGADQLDGGAGTDKLYGEDGDDVLIGGDSADLLDGGVGADTMTGGFSSDTYVVDNVGDVVIEGTDISKDIVQTALATYTLPANVEVLIGTSAGGQTLTGTALANTVTGAGGADTLHGLGGIDTLNGGGGGDTLYGGADSDKLYGDGGDDVLFGGDGNDILQGGDGADTLRGEQGNDSMTGGAGADVFVVSVGGGADSIADFDVLSDRIDLSAYGYYQVIAASGSDTLITFVTGVTLRLKGVAVGSVTDAIFIGLPTGDEVNEITGTGAADLLNGTGRADHIVGLAGIDTIKGGAGDDWIEGGTEGDKLFGDAGDDLIDGGAGNDNIQGGDGDDVLIGGAGNDALNGGLGADVFVMSLGNGADVVVGFEVGVDLIDVTAFGAYVSIVQKLTDTIITFATGSTLKVKDTLATAITDASFIGLSAPAPSVAPKPGVEDGPLLSRLVGSINEEGFDFARSDGPPELTGRALSPAWQQVELSRDAFISDWLI